MPFSEILGQEAALSFLKKAIQQQRIPSAYLFTGPHHTGKRKTAKALAQVINCQNRQSGDACGQCPPCQQIANDNYPDYSEVVAQGQNVKISQIQQASQWLQLRPDAGTYRVLVVDEAERMNNESANAFLKTLEEPPPQTLIVLIAEHPQQLLETIVSRCQQIPFQRLQPEHIQSILSQQQGLTEEQVAFLTHFSMGQIRADWLRKMEGLQTMRDLIIEWVGQMPQTEMPPIFAQLQKWATGVDSDWPYMLDFLEYWFRDCAWLLNGLPTDRVLNQDRLPQLQQTVQRWSAEHVMEAYNVVMDTRQRLLMNANVSLALHALWISLRRQLLT